MCTFVYTAVLSEWLGTCFCRERRIKKPPLVQNGSKNHKPVGGNGSALHRIGRVRTRMVAEAVHAA